MSKGIIANFSGHPLSKEAVSMLSLEYEVVKQAPPIQFDFGGDLEAQLESIIGSLGHTIDGSMPLSIIPPGQATLAILLVTYIHGITGRFPSLCYLELSENGHYMPRVEITINANSVRAAGRRYRSKVFSA